MRNINKLSQRHWHHNLLSRNVRWSMSVTPQTHQHTITQHILARTIKISPKFHHTISPKSHNSSAIESVEISKYPAFTTCFDLSSTCTSACIRAFIDTTQSSPDCVLHRRRTHLTYSRPIQILTPDRLLFVHAHRILRNIVNM